MLSILKWILSGLFSKYLVGVGIPGNASEWRIFFRKFQLLLLSIHSHGTVHACCWKKVQNYNHFLTTTNIIDSYYYRCKYGWLLMAGRYFTRPAPHEKFYESLIPGNYLAL